MLMEMQIFYHVINSLVSILQYVLQILLLSNVVDHKKQIAKTILVYCSVYLVVTILTETAIPILIKSSIIMFCIIILYRLLFTQKTALVALYVLYFWFFTLMVQEELIIFICKLIHTDPWVDIGRGVQLGKAWVIFISIFLAFVLTIVLKRVLKSMMKTVSERNTWFWYL